MGVYINRITYNLERGERGNKTQSRRRGKTQWSQPRLTFSNHAQPSGSHREDLDTQQQWDSLRAGRVPLPGLSSSTTKGKREIKDALNYLHYRKRTRW
ncbi:hypothetical protein BDZ89DRAFT_1066006 [Hymenopellis radicata]|nr:hypothetical protein BDZ89DRAFT_1066006 [Hymenopellis radicata]